MSGHALDMRANSRGKKSSQGLVTHRSQDDVRKMTKTRREAVLLKEKGVQGNNEGAKLEPHVMPRVAVARRHRRTLSFLETGRASKENQNNVLSQKAQRQRTSRESGN